MSKDAYQSRLRSDVPVADQCSHGRLWKETCVECEIVSLTEFLKDMEPRVARNRARLDELMAKGAGEVLL